MHNRNPKQSLRRRFAVIASGLAVLSCVAPPESELEPIVFDAPASPVIEEIVIEDPIVVEDDMVMDNDAVVVPPEPVADAVAVPVADPQDAVQDLTNQFALRQAKRRALADEYLSAATDAFEHGRMSDALATAASAYELQPADPDIRDLLRRIQGVVGDDAALGESFFEDARDRDTVRRAQARMAVEDDVLAARRAASAGDWERALGDLRQALLILRYNPLIATGDLDEQRVQALLESFLIQKDEADRATAADQAAAAALAASEREAAADTQQSRVIDRLFQEARDHYMDTRYDLSAASLDRILEIEPANAAALSLRGVAVEAGAASRDEALRSTFRENWTRTIQALQSMDLIQNQTIAWDLDVWKRASARGALSFAPPESSSDARAVEIVAQLGIATQLEVNYEDTDLVDVMRDLESTSGVNFLVSPGVMELADDAFVTLQMGEVSVLQILKILDEINEEWTWEVRNGIVQIVTPEEKVGNYFVAYYEIRDLVEPLPDFVPQRIQLSSPDDDVEFGREEIDPVPAVIDAADLESLIQQVIEPVSWEDADRVSIQVEESGGILVVRQTAQVHAKIEEFLEFLRQSTGIMVQVEARYLLVDDSFLQDIGVDFRGLGPGANSGGVPGPGTSAEFDDFGTDPGSPGAPGEVGSGADTGVFYDNDGNGDILARIENLFDTGLGQGFGPLADFGLLQENAPLVPLGDVSQLPTLDEVATDKGSLDNSGGASIQWSVLDDTELELVLRAVARSQRIEQVIAPQLLVHNMTTASLEQINQITYIRDYEVQIAQAASIPDPIVGKVSEGLTFTVRPVVRADRRFITLELTPQVVGLRRPLTIGLLNLAGDQVPLELPELELREFSTTVTIPDGGTLLLGGMAFSGRHEITSGTPFLNRIPILRKFFERDGAIVQNRSLLFLVRAKIVDPREQAPDIRVP